MMDSRAMGGEYVHNVEGGEVDLDILWPSAFAILNVNDALEAELRYRLRVPAAQMVLQGASVQLEITFNNNVAGFQTPPTSRYGTFHYGKWPMSNLRSLDAADPPNRDGEDAANRDDDLDVDEVGSAPHPSRMDLVSRSGGCVFG